MTLKDLRVSKGLSQVACAAYLGMSTRNYQNYENDARKANTATYANGYYGMMVNKAEILGDSAKTKMPLLINDTNTAWECVENGTPILSYFADWWLARQQ